MTGDTSRFQIALITRDRPRYLHRQLEFFRLLGNSYPVRILDGSTEENKAMNRAIASAYPWVEYQPYPESMSPVERIHRGLQDVETPYVALCADDDLVHPGGYRACVSFLDANPNYSVAVGRIYALLYSSRSQRIGYLVEDHLSNSYDIGQSDFGERMVRLKQVYELGCPPIFYAVRRTKNLRATYAHWDRLALYGSVELLDKIYSLLDGGAVALRDVFFGFRDYGSEPIRESRRNDPKLYFNEADALVVREILAKELAARGYEAKVIAYVLDLALRLPLSAPVVGKPLRATKSRLARLAQLFVTKHFPSLLLDEYGIDRDTALALRRVQPLLTA